MVSYSLKFISRFVFLVTLSIVYLNSFSQKRVALVIGVQNYIAVQPLRHSLNDANDIASILEEKGFKVDKLLDPKSKKEIKDAITQYFKSISTGVTGIIYYSGHATVHQGYNYLIPANANIHNPGDLDDQCVKMDYVMAALNSYQNLNIVILDACRSNAFPSFNRDLTQGLVNVEVPRGSIVLFAAQPGKVASDGTGRNGLFTSKLLKYMNEPNLDLSGILKKVKQEVLSESNGTQLPSYVDNSIGTDFYFSTEKNKSEIGKPEQNNIVTRQSQFSIEKTDIYETREVPEDLLFGMPELERSIYCSETYLHYNDSLYEHSLRFKSIGAKGKITGLYDSLTGKKIDYNLYIIEEKGKRTESIIGSKSSFIDSEQEVRLLIRLPKNKKIGNVVLYINSMDEEGNKYIQKAKPLLSSCLVHSVTKPRLVVK
jgi:hypothetical protein